MIFRLYLHFFEHNNDDPFLDTNDGLYKINLQVQKGWNKKFAKDVFKNYRETNNKVSKPVFVMIARESLACAFPVSITYIPNLIFKKILKLPNLQCFLFLYFYYTIYLNKIFKNENFHLIFRQALLCDTGRPRPIRRSFF